MLFDGNGSPTRKESRALALPPIPRTGWKAPQPADFPNLSSATMIAVDCETYDPELTQAGPGWARGPKGHMVGYSLAATDGLGNFGKWYFPMRHQVMPEDNLDPATCLSFAKYVLEDPSTRKVGANLLYDYGWFTAEGINIKGQLHDIQFAEALIDNNAFVGLDITANKYLGLGKEVSILDQWIEEAYHPNKSALHGQIYRAPPCLVGPYGEADADLPLRILMKQWAHLENEGLLGVYRMECDLIPILTRMRAAGISVDVNRAERLRHELKHEIQEAYDRLNYKYGFRLKSSHSTQVAKLFDHVGIEYPRGKPTKTLENGGPSITKEWLEALQHPLGAEVHDIREMEKVVGTFIESYILDKNVNGKLYCLFHPLKGESNGTKVGRFSSSDPNLQNIPSRSKLGERVRQLFIPDPGHSHWRKHDYSQIHYRILAHYAIDKGDGTAEALRQRYINDPATDYHLDVYMKVAPLLGWSTTDPAVIKVKRRPIKNVNFGLLYGQGATSLAYKSGLSGSEADDFFQAYHQGAPYVKPTMELMEQEAEINGYVTTLLGRRLRFDRYEPIRQPRGAKLPALPYTQAVQRYGTFIRLAFLYRAVNYKFQGTEPDIMKSGLLACDASGVFDVTGVPRLTVHDELDFSVPEDTSLMREAFAFIKHTMENTIKLRVPIRVDADVGPNWGDVEALPEAA